MTTFSSPRALLAKHGLVAKKSWGQNFLVAPNVYDAIVGATVETGDEWIVEIGAGLGTLTARLAVAAPKGHLVAVERDRDMVRVLESELAATPNLEIVAANALTLRYDELAVRAGRPLVVVGNLPYQIASQLLFGILDARAHVARAIVMLQREMADRLLAAPATPAYGALGVLVTTWADVRLVVRAPAGAFHPAPRVDSSVVMICPRPFGAPLPIGDETRYARVVHAAFGQRRKMLRNALGAAFAAASVDAALAVTGIDGRRRGETLSVVEFIRLANALDDAGAS